LIGENKRPVLARNPITSFQRKSLLLAGLSIDSGYPGNERLMVHERVKSAQFPNDSSRQISQKVERIVPEIRIIMNACDGGERLEMRWVFSNHPIVKGELFVPLICFPGECP
jgi:hypothetical protein